MESFSDLIEFWWIYCLKLAQQNKSSHLNLSHFSSIFLYLLKADKNITVHETFLLATKLFSRFFMLSKECGDPGNRASFNGESYIYVCKLRSFTSHVWTLSLATYRKWIFFFWDFTFKLLTRFAEIIFLRVKSSIFDSSKSFTFDTTVNRHKYKKKLVMNVIIWIIQRLVTFGS